MGKEAHEGEMRDDGMVYWPGTDIKKSMDNGFTMGLRRTADEWNAITASDLARANSTAFVEKSRKVRGVDPGSFYGISRKADEAMRITRHGGVYSRAKPRVESGASKLLDALKAGPMESAHLAPIVGTTPKKVRDMLRHYIEYDRVVLLRDTKPFRYALVEAA